MQKWLRILFVALTLLVCNAANADVTASNSNDGGRKGSMLVDATDNQQATLGNANELARICCSRPERILSSTSNFYNTLRTPVRPVNLFYIQKTSYSGYRGPGSILSRPVAAVPSAAYYVLQLRRLLC